MTQQTQATAETLALEPSDEQGFQGLYEQYNRPLYNFFANRGFTREESRDLVQETFLAAYDSRTSFRGDSSPSTWLFGIATNVWRTNVRDRRRLKRDAQVVSLDGPAHGPESDRTRAAELADAAQESRPLKKYLADERTRLLYEDGRLPPRPGRRPVLRRPRGRAPRRGRRGLLADRRPGEPTGGGFSVAVPLAALPSAAVEIRLYGVDGGDRVLLASYRTRIERDVGD